MHIKFRVTFADGSFEESHDGSWNSIKDHAHMLSPNNQKRWKQYDLISDDLGHLVGVSFESGLFVIKGQLIHPGNADGAAYTFVSGNHDYKNQHTNTDNLAYFPVYGRRQILGDWGAATLYYCGWKKRIENHEVIKMAYVYPNGQVVLT